MTQFTPRMMASSAIIQLQEKGCSCGFPRAHAPATCHAWCHTNRVSFLPAPDDTAQGPGFLVIPLFSSFLTRGLETQRVAEGIGQLILLSVLSRWQERVGEWTSSLWATAGET